jgi:hypothetical protein
MVAVRILPVPQIDNFMLQGTRAQDSSASVPLEAHSDPHRFGPNANRGFAPHVCVHRLNKMEHTESVLRDSRE